MIKRTLLLALLLSVSGLVNAATRVEATLETASNTQTKDVLIVNDTAHIYFEDLNITATVNVQDSDEAALVTTQFFKHENEPVVAQDESLQASNCGCQLLVLWNTPTEFTIEDAFTFRMILYKSE